MARHAQQLGRAGRIPAILLVLMASIFEGCSSPESDGTSFVGDSIPQPTTTRYRSSPLSDSHRWWHERKASQHQDFHARKHRVVFVGDSLTEYWQREGKRTWALEFAQYAPCNLGIAGDRVEQIRYRMTTLGLEENPPELFVVMAGTNNLGSRSHDSPHLVANEVAGLCRLLRDKCPESKVILLAIPPNGTLEKHSHLRKRVRTANALLAHKEREGGYVWHDSYRLFVDEKDQWRRSLTIDTTHFSSAGYQSLGRFLKAAVVEAIGE